MNPFLRSIQDSWIIIWRTFPPYERSERAETISSSSNRSLLASLMRQETRKLFHSLCCHEEKMKPLTAKAVGLQLLVSYLSYKSGNSWWINLSRLSFIHILLLYNLLPAVIILHMLEEDKKKIER